MAWIDIYTGKPAKTIAEPVTYDYELEGFVYRLSQDDLRQGPFATRASAIADAAWRLHPPKPLKLR